MTKTMNIPARLALALAALATASGAFAQNPADSVAARKDTLTLPGIYTDEYLDTASVKKAFVLNDYSMIGVEYGVSFCRMTFNPSQTQGTLFVPNTFGIFYSRYGKMFNYLSNFGFKVGLRYSHEGYKFKENKETGATASIEGARQAVMDVVELPFMAQFHMDGLHYKVMANLGIYGGYRKSIERTGENVSVEKQFAFLDTDRRFDYGLCGGLGFGLVFDPVEFHVNADLRYSWGTIYDPDYKSKDYYRFAYPFDIMVTAGVYFQLSRRTGRNKAQLRREAREMVFNPKKDESTDSQGR